MLKERDFELFNVIEAEYKRQNEHIELIASENFVSKAVLEAQGSVLTNKYAEGYSRRRYYGGCEYIDMVEDLAVKRACELFECKYANVQPHSGSQANMGAYGAVLNPGDTILGMSLDAGGHLTHGYDRSFSGKLYKSYSYGLDENGYIDYQQVERMALEVKPKAIVAGASAYSRIIDFKRFRDICDKVGAFLIVDMAHIAGLVAAKVHPSPIPYADIVTTTTHKTLRGPRGGLILTNNKDIAKKINSYVFPGIQGGPLMHVIAAKAVALKEASSPEFVEYAKNVVKNCSALADELTKLGYDLVSGGTDNHLVLVDIYGGTGITGKEAETILHSVNITTNKNAIHNDTLSPTITSGLRLGTAAITTRGFNEEECRMVARLIDRALKNHQNPVVLSEIKKEVLNLIGKHPYLI